MIRILRAINRFLVRIKSIILLIPEIPSNVGNPRTLSYHPDNELKSRARIYIDNLLWLIRFGEINDNYYLYGFEQKMSKKRWKDYLPYISFKNIRNRYNRRKQIGEYHADYTVILKDKFLFNRMLVSLGFPTPKVIALCSEGTLHWLDSRRTAEPEEITELEGKRVFCKSILGECADGVFPLRIKNGKIYLHGEETDIKEILERTDGSFILQEEIIQHPEMSRLFPNSVNSMRIISFHRKTEPEILYALLRTGTGENTSDNWAVGGLLGMIDMETGKLDNKFLYKPGFGTSRTEHPDTGVVFADFRIPFLDRAMDMARELHSYLYGVKSIGWDVAISEEGPVFIEGNDNWEMNCFQINGGAREKTLSWFRKP